MTQSEQQKAAKKFSEEWKDKGYEKGQAQPFWRDLLYHVFGVKNITNYIEFETKVNNGFIDAYIEKTKVLIEQKSSSVNLEKPDNLKSVFNQAKKYSDDLPYSKKPKWIVVCNFKSFFIYNMDYPNKEPEKILLKDLETDYYRLSFLVDKETQSAIKEESVSFPVAAMISKMVFTKRLLSSREIPESHCATVFSRNLLVLFVDASSTKWFPITSQDMASCCHTP